MPVRLPRSVTEMASRLNRPVTRQRAIDMTLTPIAIGQALASIEALTVGRLYRRDGLLRGVSANSAAPGTLRHRALSLLDSPATPKVLAGITLAGSAVLLVARGHRKTQVAAAAVIGLCNRLNEIRTPYGRDGADQMTGVITQYRALSALVPNPDRSDDLFLRAVNVQSGLSYFVSGLSKFFGSSWVQGDALGDILQTQAYGNGPAAGILKRYPKLARLMTWSTPVWEMAFPLVYLVPPVVGRQGLTAVKGFHLAVAAVMELPRFLWGFAGSHGAVRYVIDRPQGGQTRVTKLERLALGTASGVALTSVMYAATLRQQDNQRRLGLKGTSLLQVEDGAIEYKWTAPQDPAVDVGVAPVVVLEAGLGNALEAWTWVFDGLSPDCHVVAYHRKGYGLTTSHRSSPEAVQALVDNIPSSGPIIAVSHSLGILRIAEYATSDLAGRRISAAVFIDATDPDLLAADRSNRRRVGGFVQAQVNTMFAAVSGVYNFAPNAVARQSAYPPDEQSGLLQFVYAPRNICRSTREYFEVETDGVVDKLRLIDHRYLIASQENAAQQNTLADKLGAPRSMVDGSSHRSILGYRRFAEQVVAVIRRAVNDAL